MKKVFCTFIAIVMLLSLISCGINPAAKYPIIDIIYEYDSMENDSMERLQNLGYSSTDDGFNSFFVYSQDGKIQNLSKGNSIINSEFLYDNESEYFLINFWSKKSWEYYTRYGLHENAYIIALEDGTRWDFKKGQIILTISSEYAYYLEGVEIHKMNLVDETDNTVVYTFPFKKKLPKNPMVTIDGVKTELAGWYIFTISDQNILVQGRSYTGGETIYYDFADIEI